MIHVRHAAVAIESGLCSTVLITHGESGRSRVGCAAAPAMLWRRRASPASSSGPIYQWARRLCSGSRFTLHEDLYGLTDETLAIVSVAQREWAMENPRATVRTDYGRARAQSADDRLSVRHSDTIPGIGSFRLSRSGSGRTMAGLGQVQPVRPICWLTPVAQKAATQGASGATMGGAAIL